MKNSVGIDLTEIDRIKKIIVDTPAFLTKIFTESERDEFNKKGKGIYQSVAGSFSVKEAFSKALGSGFSAFFIKYDIKKRIYIFDEIIPYSKEASEMVRENLDIFRFGNIAENFSAEENINTKNDSCEENETPKLDTNNYIIEKIACFPAAIEVLHDRLGRPYVNLKGDLEKIKNSFDISVSITHSDATAAAVVILNFKEAL